MTTIHFHYTDSYNNPSRGSLAFMPHRRHAANETEVLPKPFTIPLLNGEVTVNLQPNSSSWVWIVTEYFEGVSKSFYTTVPDRDGVLEHTELIHISPSSIPAPYDAVEPAWWAEMRQYKTTVSDTLVKSGEALTEARAAIDTGQASITQTRDNASLAKAYANESRESSYESRQYRDEAEQWRNEAQEQADRAATGPESAAARADASAAAAEASETAARDYENQSRTHAAEARADATTAQNAASTAITANTEAQTAATTATTQANRSQDYADELMAGPRDYVNDSKAARDEAQQHATTAETHATTAETIQTNLLALSDTVEESVTTATEQADRAETQADRAEATAIGLEYTEWQQLELINGWTAYRPCSYRITPMGFQFRGVIDGTEATNALFAYVPVDEQKFSSDNIVGVGANDPLEYARIHIGANAGTLSCYDGYGGGRVYINFISPKL